MFLKSFTVLLILILVLKQYNCQTDFIELAKQNGYFAEEHEIITKDGYILKIHRIPHGRNSTITNKYPVLLIPGTSATSEAFILIKGRSFGFVMVKNGYDTWFFNPRGTHYSRHPNMSNTDRKFWDYSITEIGVYDTAAAVDYILNETSREKLTIVGQSQGSTTVFVFLSVKPEYNDKVNLAIHITPSIYYDNYNIPLIDICVKHFKTVEYLVNEVLGLYYVPSVKGILNGLTDFCNVTSGTQSICLIIFETIDYGAHIEKMYDMNVLMNVLRYMPAGFSIKLILHFLQFFSTGLFRDYDYGEEKNLDRYGTKEPPSFDVGKISVPSVLIYSRYDYLVPSKAINKLIKSLQKPIPIEVPYFDFRHITYLFSKNVTVIYPKLLNLMKQYNKV